MGIKLSNAALSAIVVILWIGIAAAVVSHQGLRGGGGFAAGAAVLPGALEVLTNGGRVSAGVSALMDNPLLDEAAGMKAHDMLQNQYYAHTSPAGRSPFYWLDQVGYNYLNVGENLDLVRSGTEEVVNSDWMNSSEHRTNILLPQFTETGIGVASGTYEGSDVTFVVELFATPMPKATTSVTVLPAKTPEPAPLSAAPVPVHLPLTVSDIVPVLTVPPFIAASPTASVPHAATSSEPASPPIPASSTAATSSASVGTASSTPAYAPVQFSSLGTYDFNAYLTAFHTAFTLIAGVLQHMLVQLGIPLR